MTKESDLAPESWKYKYLETLDEFEGKEKSWHEMEQVLRRGLNRVSLISVGVDSTLDRQLANLRRSLQKDVKPPHLNEIIESIAERVKTLDEQRESNSALFEPAGVLQRLVETINFPRGAVGQVVGLKKRLNQADAPEHLDELIDAFAQLMNSVFYQEPASGSDVPMLETPAQAPPKKAWWKNIFSPGKAAPSFAQSGVEQKITRAVASAAPTTAVEDIFLDILECLVFPPQFSQRVQDLKEQLSCGLSANAVRAMTQSVVALVVDMRTVLEDEKEALEAFLLQLTQHLSELGAMAEGAETTRIASLTGHRQLDAMVAAQVSDIEATVHNAHDVEQMKGAIQVSLEKIREHLAEQGEQEEQRQKILEGQLKSMTRRVQDMEGESQHLRDKLAEKHIQATTDPLTGAPNRLAYEKRIAEEYARWQRYHNPLSMLICDVDHFKQVNDTYGHKAGDRALMAIVKTVQQYLRESDFLARIGGEEFVILLPETSLADAQIAADKLRRSIEVSEFAYQGQPVPITISAGLADFRQGDTVDAVCQRADKALYRAKNQGRNRIVVA